MAITRLSNSGIKTGVLKYDSALAGYPPVMAAPTAATASSTSATVSFSTISGATNYRAISTPGSLTGTSATSPITVTGLTTGVAYTFQIQAQNSVGYGGLSAASNSVTPESPESYFSIASASPNSVTTVTFSSIPSTYQHLQLRIHLRVGGGSPSLALTFNSDSNQNYTHHYFGNYNDQATPVSGNSLSRPSIPIGYLNGFRSGVPGVAILDIFDYASTAKLKSVRQMVGNNGNGSGETEQATNLWQSTSAINTITISVTGGNNFTSGSLLTLYGIKG